MASNTDFISRLRTLKLAYDEKLITKDEYDKCRLKELDNWSESELKNIFPIYSFQNFY